MTVKQIIKMYGSIMPSLPLLYVFIILNSCLVNGIKFYSLCMQLHIFLVFGDYLDLSSPQCYCFFVIKKKLLILFIYYKLASVLQSFNFVCFC